VASITAKNKLGKQTMVFGSRPVLYSTASVVGSVEGEGPLREHYDIIVNDQLDGEKTFEKGERKMLEDAVQVCINKAHVQPKQVEAFVAGDLLNQIISASFAARGLSIPFLGVYGACSTMAESLLVAASLVDGGYCDLVLAATSSHYDTAERQYRYPNEYGGQRPPYAQNTVTGAGCALVSSMPKPGEDRPWISLATVGKVLDMGIKDPFDMGTAMAPAAADTIYQHLNDTGQTPEAYDAILTGDLGLVGKDILRKLLEQKNIQLGANYDDCGAMIYDVKKQPVFSGGSGCACSAAVVYGYGMNQMMQGRWRRILVVATGALLSPTTYQQGESIPCIAHAVVLEKGGR
jgi:stage V sporulation protein AD